MQAIIDTVTKYVDFPTRVLMALLFLMSAHIKITQVAAMQGYMHAYGVPGMLLWPAAAREFMAGLLLVAGMWVRPLSLGLAGWCVLTAAIFHTDLSVLDMELHFFKNMAMAGGFLLVAKSGAPGFGVDGWLASRRG